MAKTQSADSRPGFIRSLRAGLRYARAVWRQQSVSDLDTWIERAFGGMSTSGMVVTQETANNFTAYYSGVLQISQTIGSCPLHLYNRVGKGKEVETRNALNTVLSLRANQYLDAYRWKELMQHHAINWGNGYSLIQRNTNQEIVAMWPLMPDRVSMRIRDDGAPEYIYRRHAGDNATFPWDRVFHLAGFGFDGYQGYPLLTLFQDAIGLGLAQQEFQNRFLANGAHLPGFYEHPGVLSEGAANRLREDLEKAYSGLANAGRSPVLEEGMKYVPLNMPLKDAEFLASRVFQIQEIARILNIPTPKLKDYSKLTYSNAEQLAIEYRTDTIRPWAERWEAAINMQLLTPAQQANGAFAEFDLNAIARGDMKTEAEAYREGRYGGWLSANEIRGKQGLNPIENAEVGDRYWQPVNMVDAAAPAPTQGSIEGPTESEA